MERGRLIRRNAALEAICRLPLRSVHHVIGGVFPGGKLEDAEAPVAAAPRIPLPRHHQRKAPRSGMRSRSREARPPPAARRSARSSSTRWESSSCAGQATPPRADRCPRRYLPCAPSARISHPGGRFPPCKQGSRSSIPCIAAGSPESSSHPCRSPIPRPCRTSHAQSQIVSQAPAMPPMPPVPNPGWKPPIARTQLSQCLDTSLRV